MKKGIILTLVAGGFFSLMLSSCGEKFTPLTEEQIQVQADSVFNAQKDAKLTELRAACDAKVEAEANAKFEALKAEATGTASK